MTEEQKDKEAEEDSTDDVQGHDAREATILPQRPILFLDEAEEIDDQVL